MDLFFLLQPHQLLPFDLALPFLTVLSLLLHVLESLFLAQLLGMFQVSQLPVLFLLLLPKLFLLLTDLKLALQENRLVLLLKLNLLVLD